MLCNVFTNVAVVDVIYHCRVTCSIKPVIFHYCSVNCHLRGTVKCHVHVQFYKGVRRSVMAVTHEVRRSHGKRQRSVRGAKWGVASRGRGESHDGVKWNEI